MKILVTAGPTVEPLDPIRYLSNRSTGRMGYAMTAAALEKGHEVTLVSGPTTLPWPSQATGCLVESAQEMAQAVCDLVDQHQIFILSAAVADYTPIEVLDDKRPKNDDVWKLELKRTPDILARLGEIKKTKQILVLAGFCVETVDHEMKAREKLLRKKADLILANDRAVLGSDQFEGWLVQADTEAIFWPQMEKAQAARRYFDVIMDLAEKRMHAAN